MFSQARSYSRAPTTPRTLGLPQEMLYSLRRIEKLEGGGCDRPYSGSGHVCSMTALSNICSNPKKSSLCRKRGTHFMSCTPKRTAQTGAYKLSCVGTPIKVFSTKRWRGALPLQPGAVVSEDFRPQPLPCTVRNVQSYLPLTCRDGSIVATAVSFGITDLSCGPSGPNSSERSPTQGGACGASSTWLASS